MVRINIISPKKLTDQHLVAEYVEIMMLVGYVKNYPDLNNLPKNYCLGKGHIRFFKNKLSYLKKRHELIKKEMRRRGFVTNKTISLENFGNGYRCDWKPSKKDKEIINERIRSKIRMKPKFYRYYGMQRNKRFLVNLLG